LGGAWRGLELPFELAKLRRWEWWMNKVGIALFLMGVVFLFKFSWDRGWLQVLLTPAVRVGLGILLGTALVWVGLRVYAGRRAFAQVVLGGGIGTYYITGFAAFNMLGVFSYPVAFAFMAAVTVLALRPGAAPGRGGAGRHRGLRRPRHAFPALRRGRRPRRARAVRGARPRGGYGDLPPQRLAFALAGRVRWVLGRPVTGYAGVDPIGPLPVADGVALQAGVLFGWVCCGSCRPRGRPSGTRARGVGGSRRSGPRCGCSRAIRNAI
jgi:hypothetical protein